MYALSFSPSLFSLLQLYSRCSTVWFPLTQGHSGDSIILNRCRYNLVFPWAVTIAVKLGVRFHFQPVLNVWEKFFGCRSFSGVVPLLLPLFYAFLSFLMLYFTFWDFAVAHVTISGGLLSKFVSEHISIVSCMCLYPGVFCVPFFFLQCNGLLSDFFY